MNRSFTTREKILLVVLTVLLLGVGYFKLFLQPMEQRVEAFQERQNTAQDQMMIEAARLRQMRKMDPAAAGWRGAGHGSRGR